MMAAGTKKKGNPRKAETPGAAWLRALQLLQLMERERILANAAWLPRLST
jgi:hypothetical protein